jgi:hypothetical protein
MKTMYFNLIIVLFLICFIQKNDAFSSPRKGVDLSFDVSEIIQKSSKNDIDIPDLLLNELFVESKKIKKKKNIHADMDNDPWPIFINKKLPENKRSHGIIEKFEKSPISSVSSFLKLVQGGSYARRGLVYKAIENGIVFPEGMDEKKILKRLTKAWQHKILDIVFVPNLLIDAYVGYHVKTPIYLYDCLMNGKIVFQYFLWRQSEDPVASDVGPKMKKDKVSQHFQPTDNFDADFYLENKEHIDTQYIQLAIPFILKYISDKKLYKKCKKNKLLSISKLKFPVSSFFEKIENESKKDELLYDELLLTPRRVAPVIQYGATSSVCGVIAPVSSKKIVSAPNSEFDIFEEISIKSDISLAKDKMNRQSSKKSVSAPILHADSIEEIVETMKLKLDKSPRKFFSFIKSPRGDQKKKIIDSPRQ